MLINVVNRENFDRGNVMTIIINSPVGKNVFLGLPEYKMIEYVKDTHSMFGHEGVAAENARLALS